MKGIITIVTMTIVIPGLVANPAYSQTYDEWFAEGWDLGWR